MRAAWNMPSNYNHAPSIDMKTSRNSRRRRSARTGAPTQTEPAESGAPLELVQIWDLPTRLCHWALVTLLLVQVVSGELSFLPTAWHLWAGYLLLLAVVFRLVWGFVGSDSAHFGPMIASLRGLPGYLPLLFSRQPTRWPGHNPVGTLSSLLLLLLLLISCFSGLFIETWGDYRGPLAERVSRDLNLWMTDLHSLVRWPLYLLVAIHMVAVLGYLLFKGEDRMTPMFGRGRILVRQDKAIVMRSNQRAVCVLLVCLALVAAIVVLGPIA